MNDETVIFFGNRDLGLRILQHLIYVGDVPRAVFLHPRGTSRWTDQLWELAGSIDAVVMRADELEGSEAFNTVKSLRPSIGVSAYFGHILRAKMLALFPLGILNFHGSLLPWNRGRDPNAWAIYENTPAGGTIHLMDEGVDTGPILLQREVVVSPDMDATDIYHGTVEALVNLFEENWPLLRTGSISARSQGEEGTSHRRREFERLRQLDLTEEMTLHKAINLLRACAVDECTAAEFVEGGRRYSVRIRVTPVQQADTEE
ncbi:MAG: formyltransferase family protein [Chitinophagaceae bacterium]